MNRASYIRIMSGDAKGIGASSARAGLSLLSAVYLAAWKTRKAAYGTGLVRQEKVGVKVISIGNITAGGTGKTPATIFYARKLLEEGRKVAVLSRGYGRTTQIDEAYAVSDGKDILLSPKEAGDEPYLVAAKLNHAPVVVCGKRVKGARFAIENFSPEIILLDDGFQHIALARDEDIVIIDCTIPFGFGHMLPRGLLREPLSALKRATQFLLTHADKSPHERVVDTLRNINPSAAIKRSTHRPVKLSYAASDGTVVCEEISGKKILALSSIGNPAAFEETLRSLGAFVVNSLAFKDHHWYNSNDLQRIRRVASESGVEYIVTTEKDGVRLALLPNLPSNLLILEIELQLLE